MIDMSGTSRQLRYVFVYQPSNDLKLWPIQYGVTALHMACLHGHTNVIRSLLQAGAHPETTDLVRNISCTNHKNFLIVAKINLTHIFAGNLNPKSDDATNSLSQFGQNSLHYAAMCVKINRSSVVQLVIDSGIDLNLKDHVRIPQK